MTPSRYPLAWPAHRPRTPNHNRRQGKFAADGKSITMVRAIERVQAEVERLGGRYALLSSNVETRLDGLPRSGAKRPEDPGVCLYFQLKGEPFAMACDAYSSPEQNLAAIAAHIEATRAIERHGVATAPETLQAFSALPPPSAEPQWWEILGLARDADAETISAAYRAKAKGAASDHDALLRLNLARDAAIQAVTQ